MVGRYARTPMTAWGVVFTIGILVGGALLLAASMTVMSRADHLGILDDPTVMDQAESACDRLDAEVGQLGVAGAGPADRVARIRAEDVAVGHLVASMRSLGDDRLEHDHPAVSWLQDWETLVALREHYADELAVGGSPVLVVPRVDDIPVTHRMTELSSCTVVEQLAAMA